MFHATVHELSSLGSLDGVEIIRRKLTSPQSISAFEPEVSIQGFKTDE
jgi:hypothetical protein